MSLVGPLVNPNTLEDRFDRVATNRPLLKHPLLIALAVLAASSGAAAYALHIRI